MAADVRSFLLQAQGRITVSASRLYHPAYFNRAVEGTITLELDSPGVRVFSVYFRGIGILFYNYWNWRLRYTDFTDAVDYADRNNSIIDR
jgi:hypothetical protein